jgi:hypothetical protein
MRPRPGFEYSDPPSAGIGAIPILGVLLLAFASRVYGLDFQSLWGDEGISLLRASLPFDEMMRVLPREHVPGYWLLLRVWLSAAGTSDFALRYLSVLPSVLAIAFAYRLAAELGSWRGGLIAALLLATSVFQVWYAQEARMYSWLAATGIGSTWLLWRLLNARKPALPFLGYVLLVSAAINLHFYGFLIPLAHTVFVVVWLMRTRNWRSFLRWIAAGLLVLLLYASWWTRLLNASEFKGCCPALDPILLPWRFFTAFTVGDAMPDTLHAWLPWVYLILVPIGVWAWFRRNLLGGWLLSCAALVPLTAVLAIALVTRGFYHERYAIFVSVPLAMLVGAAISAMDFRTRAAGGQHGSVPRRSALSILLAAFILTGLVGANLTALRRLRTDSSVQKADFRAIAWRIAAAELPGDVILVHGLDPREVFMHYYEGQLPVKNVQQLVGLSDNEVEAALAEITGGLRRAWVLHYDPPTTAIEYWLSGHAWLGDRTKYGNENLTLSLYGLEGLQKGVLANEMTFGDGLRLKRITVAGGAQGGLSFRAGDVLGVTTEWDVLAPLPSLNFSLRLLDDEGRTWRSADYVPLEGSAPTLGWEAGKTVEDRRGLVLPPDLPPGTYQVVLLLYEPSTGVPISVRERDGATLATIEVSPAAVAADPASLPIPARVNRRLGDHMELLGYSISPQPLLPDQSATLALWWRAVDRPTPSDSFRIQATGPGGQLAFDGEYPLSRTTSHAWEPGQVRREYYDLAVEPAAASGIYRLQISAAEDGSASSAAANLGTVAVRARERTYRLPRISHPLKGLLDDSILLRGYDLTVSPPTERDIKLTLYWQANRRVPSSYKVFVHLVDEAGNIVAQADALPADGLAPTDSWLSGEVVVDKHKLTAPRAGRYRVLVGLYDPATGSRLPALEATAGSIHENAISLQEVEVP